MNRTYFLLFLFIVGSTLIITHWAAQRKQTTRQFFIADSSLSGFQNGMAIAGDYISAASFLGITGAIALGGYDGFLYSIGFLVSYLLVLLVIAEPVRHLGKYSLADVICARFPGNRIRLAVAAVTFTISIFYMIPQLVATGLLVRLLLGNRLLGLRTGDRQSDDRLCGLRGNGRHIVGPDYQDCSPDVGNLFAFIDAAVPFRLAVASVIATREGGNPPWRPFF